MNRALAQKKPEGAMRSELDGVYRKVVRATCTRTNLTQLAPCSGDRKFRPVTITLTMPSTKDVFCRGNVVFALHLLPNIFDVDFGSAFDFAIAHALARPRKEFGCALRQNRFGKSFGFFFAHDGLIADLDRRIGISDFSQITCRLFATHFVIIFGRCRRDNRFTRFRIVRTNDDFFGHVHRRRVEVHALEQHAAFFANVCAIPTQSHIGFDFARFAEDEFFAFDFDFVPDATSALEEEVEVVFVVLNDIGMNDSRILDIGL